MAEPGAKPSAGAAMCTPTRTEPSARRVTENASSISVVVASSRLNAATSASGRSAGNSGAGTSGNAAPRGKCSKRNRPR